MAVLVQDNFDRANSTTVIGSPQVGPAPTVRAGTGGINGNRVYAATATMTATWDTGTPNVKLQATAIHTGTSGRNFGFVLGWESATDYWLFQIHDTQACLIQRQNTGGFNTYATTRIAPSTALIGVEHYDGIIAMYIDNVRVARLDALEIGAKQVTSGHHGIRFNHNTIRADDLLIEDSGPIPIDSVGATPSVGLSHVAVDDAVQRDVFAYLGRDTKEQDILGGF